MEINNLWNHRLVLGRFTPPLPYCFFQSQEGILDLTLRQPGLKDGGLAVILTNHNTCQTPPNPMGFLGKNS